MRDWLGSGGKDRSRVGRVGSRRERIGTGRGAKRQREMRAWRDGVSRIAGHTEGNTGSSAETAVRSLGDVADLAKQRGGHI